MQEINSTDLKRNLGAILGKVLNNNNRYKIFRYAHKAPTAVLISVADYEHFLSLEEKNHET